jgi:hypothetical protein
MGRPERSNGREHMSQCGQRMSFNRTRVAGHLDEIQDVAARYSYFGMGPACSRILSELDAMKGCKACVDRAHAGYEK